MKAFEYINKDTLSDIEQYISLHLPPGLILYGPNGLGKSNISAYIASTLLNCDEADLFKNPDFFYLSGRTDLLKVEQIECLLEKSMMTGISGRKVFLLEEGYNMSIRAQNRLLKLLEDHNETNVVIFTASRKSLLPTIKSRCSSIYFHPLKDTAMQEFLKDEGVSDKYLELTSYLLENCPFRYEPAKAYLPEFYLVYEQMIQLKNSSDLLELLGFLKEKDKESFFERNVIFQKELILLLSFPFHQVLLAKTNLKITDDFYTTESFYNFYDLKQSFTIQKELLNHVERAKKNYTKNDFLDLLRFIIKEEKHAL